MAIVDLIARKYERGFYSDENNAKDRRVRSLTFTPKYHDVILVLR